VCPSLRRIITADMENDVARQTLDPHRTMMVIAGRDTHLTRSRCHSLCALYSK